jgi:FkbM family methyltransferase
MAPPPSAAALELAAAFLSPQHPGRRFLLGRNEHSAALLAQPAIAALIEGVVDDRTDGVSWHGKPVLRGEALPRGAMVVNCAMSIAPVSAARRLAALELGACLSYADLMTARPDLVPTPAFVAQTRADQLAHGAQWRALENSFADAESRQVLRDVLRFRLTADPVHMASYAVRFSDQYFEHFLGLSEEVFVDAGGYDGDTTEEFCKRYPDYRSVALFEPSAINMAAARRRLAGQRDIRFIAEGISDQPGVLWFNPDAGSASSVSSAGASSITVTTLDVALTSPVTFIKMDLEGWEMQALAGSVRHIREDHPKLAISVYHSAADFWRIPAFITGIRADYNLYLRHYSEGWSETIMFFVPRLPHKE